MQCAAPTGAQRLSEEALLNRNRILDFVLSGSIMACMDSNQLIPVFDDFRDSSYLTIIVTNWSLTVDC